MPWCPVCKNEYKDGYTLCADCGAELVDFLSDDVKEDDIAPSDESSEEVISENELSETIDNIKLQLGTLSAEELQELVDKETKAASVKPYVKASDRAENYRSSAFALLFVGIIGVIFLILSYLKIIPLNLAPNISVIFYVVMGLLFVVFIVIGVKSLSSAKAIADTAEDEDALTDRIYTFFKENHNEDTIDGIAFSNEDAPLTSEEKYFPRSKAIKQLITDNFGELDEAYLTELCENIYSDIFDK